MHSPWRRNAFSSFKINSLYSICAKGRFEKILDVKYGLPNYYFRQVNLCCVCFVTFTRGNRSPSFISNSYLYLFRNQLLSEGTECPRSVLLPTKNENISGNMSIMSFQCINLFMNATNLFGKIESIS